MVRRRYQTKIDYPAAKALTRNIVKISGFALSRFDRSWGWSYFNQPFSLNGLAQALGKMEIDLEQDPIKEALEVFGAKQKTNLS
jgi:hypothetical protein